MPSSDEMELPSDSEIRSEMESLMKTVDLNKMSTKVRKQYRGVTARTESSQRRATV